MKKVSKSKRVISLILTLLIVITTVFSTVVPAFAATESKSNPVTKIKVAYDGGTLIVGNSVKKTSFTVTGTKKDGTISELTTYKIANPKITSETQTLRFSYKNKAGETLESSYTVKAITDFKSITASLDDSVSLDYGSSIKKDMFNVTAVLSNGRKKSLASDAFSISKTKYDSTSTSMTVTVSATNASGKELKKSVRVTADKAITKIKAVYSGSDKDAGEKINKSDFTVTGTTVDKKTVKVTDFDLSASILEKKSNSIKVTYTNSFGKTLSSSVSVPANKVIVSIATAEYVGGQKNVGDPLTKDDFKVTGKNVKKEIVDITDFELSSDVVDKENTSIKIIYKNTVDSTLTKSVKVTANNNIESISAVRKSEKDIYVGDRIKASDFTVTAIYHNGTEKKLSSSKYTIDKDTVTSANDVITVTYTDNKTQNTLTTTVTINSKDTTTADGAYAMYVGDPKAVGDTVTESDFKVYVPSTSGASEEVTDFKIKSGNKLKGASNSVVITFTCTNGDKGTVECIVNAGNEIVAIDVDDGESTTAYGEGSSISSANIEKVISVYFVYASGERTLVKHLKSNGVKVYASNGGQELTGSGKMTLSEKSDNNKIIVKYKDLSKEYSIDTDFVKIDQTITAANSSVTVKVGSTVTPGIKGNVGTLYFTSSNNSIAVMKDGKIFGRKAGTCKIKVYAGSFKSADGKKYNKSKTIYINVKVEKSNKKTNTISASNLSMSVGNSKSVKSVASAKTTITATSSDSSVVAISNGKLVAKKAGTAKITYEAKGTETYQANVKSVTVTVKAAAKKTNTISASSTLSMKVGSSKSISSIASAKTTITATSSSSSVVTVKNGKLVAKKAGTAKITIKAAETSSYKSATKTITITVKK